jgi:general secretion pathway protein J
VIRARRQLGFTLLELIVAMLLLALIALLLYNGLYTVTRTSRTVEARTQVLEDVAVTHRLLRRELAQFQHVVVRNPDGKPVPAFTGDARGMRWIAPLPSHRGGRALYWLVLTLEPPTSRNAKAVLGLEYLPLTTGAAAPRSQRQDGGERVLLLTGVEQMTCQYLRAATKEKPAEWLSQWSEAGLTPAAVRIRLRRTDDDRAMEWLLPLRVRYVDAAMVPGAAEESFW